MSASFSVRVCCVLCLFGACVAGTLAQVESTTQPQDAELTFVRGEARPVSQLAGSIGAVPRMRMQVGRGNVAPNLTVVATLKTTPALSESGIEVHELYTQWEAFVAVFGWTNPKQPHDVARHDYGYPEINVDGRAFIGRQTIAAEGDSPETDLWTIEAVDEPTARALSEALVRSYRRNTAAALQKARDVLQQHIAEAERLRKAIVDDEALLKRLDENARKLGAYGMTLETLDAAIARFDQERRLNEVEIAGTQASLQTANERLKSIQVDPRNEMSLVLLRIQVELEIQLVGKLARKDALGRTLEQLQDGRKQREEFIAVQERIREARPKLADYEKNHLPRAEESVQRLEKLAAFTITDNRVVISPILRTNP